MKRNLLKLLALALLIAGLIAADFIFMTELGRTMARASTPTCQLVHVTEGTVKYPLEICNSGPAVLHSTAPWYSKSFPESNSITAVNVTPISGTCRLADVQENSGNGPNFVIRACKGTFNSPGIGKRWVLIVDGGPLPERSTSTPVIVIAETT